MSRRFLIRLYPRAWRRRYGDEFALLLEATPVSVGVLANVLAAASREWLLRTITGRLVLGPVIAYIALLTAQLLAAVVQAEPLFSYDAGQTIVTPPWPVGLGFVQPLVMLAAVARLALTVLRESRMSGSEFAYWAFSLFVAAVGWQWGSLVGQMGTGVEPWSVWTIWSYSAVSTTSNLMMLMLAAQGMPKPHQAPSPYAGSNRPLGLS